MMANELNNASQDPSALIRQATKDEQQEQPKIAPAPQANQSTTDASKT